MPLLIRRLILRVHSRYYEGKCAYVSNALHQQDDIFYNECMGLFDL